MLSLEFCFIMSEIEENPPLTGELIPYTRPPSSFLEKLILFVYRKYCRLVANFKISFDNIRDDCRAYKSSEYNLVLLKKSNDGQKITINNKSVSSVKISSQKWKKLGDFTFKSSYRIAFRNASNSHNFHKAACIPDPESLKLGEAYTVEITVVFVDIVNFTGINMSSSDSQQNVLMQMDLLFSSLFKIVQDEGGFVEKNTGDGLFCYFDSSDDKNSIEKAIKASVMMMAFVENGSNPLFKNIGINDLDINITIDHGEITLAYLGNRKRFKALVAIGLAANRAEKMFGAIKGLENKIIVGHDVLMKIKNSDLKKLFAYNKAIEVVRRTSRKSSSGTRVYYDTYFFMGRWEPEEGYYLDV